MLDEVTGITSKLTWQHEGLAPDYSVLGSSSTGEHDKEVICGSDGRRTTMCGREHGTRIDWCVNAPIMTANGDYATAGRCRLRRSYQERLFGWPSDRRLRSISKERSTIRLIQSSHCTDKVSGHLP